MDIRPLQVQLIGFRVTLDRFRYIRQRLIEGPKLQVQIRHMFPERIRFPHLPLKRQKRAVAVIRAGSKQGITLVGFRFIPVC